MFDFLHKQTAQTQPQDIEALIAKLNNAIRAQYINGNITPLQLQKFIELVGNSIKLRAALTML